MGHDHSHSGDRSKENRKRLTVVLGLTSTYMVAEVVGGLLTGSLALLADASHMLTDVAGLALALFSMKLAEKPATPERTYGYYRAEILAALANAVVLIGISLYVLYEAYERFRNPPEIQSSSMLAVATVGLVINVVGLFIMKKSASDSLNMKGAYFEVLSDFLASVGVILAAAVMWFTGWYYADPLVSAGIGLFIFPRTWHLMKEAVGVLLEGTPSDINLAEVRKAILEASGVAGVHDLHVWALTSKMNAMSVHVVRDEKIAHDAIREDVQQRVKSTFEIDHVTIQVESKGCEIHETHL